MFEENLNKIIKSIELQNRGSSEITRPSKNTGLITISLTDLKILTDTFSNIFPEKIRSFSDELSIGLNELSNPGLSPDERNRKELEIAALLENNIEPLLYLNSLNQELIAPGFNQSSLEKLNQSYNLSFKDPGQSGREQYLENLAESYAQGNTSDTVEYLLKTGNTIFIEHSGFVNDIKTATRITERERLKKKMQFLDELETFDLPESEIRTALQITERERLKEVMRKIDARAESKGKLFGDENRLPFSQKTDGSAKIISIEKNQFNWRRLAIAAGVIGVIAISTAIIFNTRKNSSGIVRNNPGSSDTIKNIHDRDQNKKDELANIKWDSAGMVLTVRKEAAMGFAVKQEKITTHIYWLKEKIASSPELQKQIDSLNKQDKTYTFINNTLSVYLATHDLQELYKIDNKYYLKIADTLYHIRPSDKPIKLNKVTDHNISDRIDKINYQQDIK